MSNYKDCLHIFMFNSSYVVEYGSRDWRLNTLLRLKFVNHFTASHKPANEQVVVILPKAYKYSPEQENNFDYSKLRRFYIADKQCHAVVNQLVYSTHSQFLSQNITQLINYYSLSYRLFSLFTSKTT